MGQQQSREEILYTEAAKGNVQAIKSLHSNGASLEWLDEEGKTPLMVACSSAELFIVAKTLIELGANISSFCAGGDGGTPLHHAAERGLHQTVNLLLSHGANPLLRNLDGKTSLDVARNKGFFLVVRSIENRISLFSGWMRQFYGPRILEALSPQMLSRKIWVVILPCRLHHDLNIPLELKLLIYLTLRDAIPCDIIHLQNADIKESNLHQSDPVLIILDKSTKRQYRFASANDGDRQQLKRLYNSCRGITQVMDNETQYNSNGTNGWEDLVAESAHNGWGQSGGPTLSQPTVTMSAKTAENPAAEVYNGWGTPESTSHSNYSNEPVTQENNGWALPESISSEEYSGWGVPESKRRSDNLILPVTDEYNGWGPPEPISSEEHNGWGGPESRRPNSAQPVLEQDIGWRLPESMEGAHQSNEVPSVGSIVPSAPPVPEESFGEKDSVKDPQVLNGAPNRNESKEESTCTVCWEFPAEGACIPCGHMAGCMSCLNAIKSKQGSCPICRTPVDQDTVKSPPAEYKIMKKATALSIAVTTVFYLLCGCMGYAGSSVKSIQRPQVGNNINPNGEEDVSAE